MSQIYLRNRWFEDIPVGEFHVFGSHTFSELEMVEFATRYAPQPEFTDPEAARELRWRGLVATPWAYQRYLDAQDGGLHGSLCPRC